MIAGFQLRTLRVTGKGKEPAEVTFGEGCNVISGASNTGKSFILQCIDFMLGSTKRPKSIKESSGYESVFLEIEDREGRTHELERSLSGHAFIHRTKADGAIREDILSEKHDPNNKATISGFLLDLSKGWGLKIRQNQAGKTRTLSFRDLAWIALMDEMRIIGDGSPVLSGQYTTKPEELSLFKLLLTGVDDGSVIARESLKDSKAKQKAQLELLDRMIPALEAEIADIDKEPASIEERRKRIDATVAARSEVLSASQLEIAGFESRRRDAWEKTKDLERRQASTTELRNRFALLKDHYNNDLARLQAIIEIEHFFSQLQQVRCPLCGANSEQHDPTMHDGSVAVDELENIRRASRAEMNKIKGLLRDLVGSTDQLDSQLVALGQQYSQQTSLLESAAQEIANRLAPVAKQYQMELSEAMEIRDRLSQAETLQGRLKSLNAERARIAGIVWKREPKEANSNILFSQAVETFTLRVQAILSAWKYPELTRVTFSDDKVDLIISGKERGSEGKGFRAIANAAFMIALLEYCEDSKNEIPHPGFVVLDSPLVTYKRRDTEPGEEIPEDVTSAFYGALSKLPPNRQVIVLENNDPSPEFQPIIRYTHFSRSAVGRYGFFPIPHTQSNT